MTKKYNNNSKYFKDWSTKKLKEEATSYDQLIKIESYGSKDVNNLLGICLELERRGIEIHTNIEFK